VENCKKEIKKLVDNEKKYFLIIFLFSEKFGRKVKKKKF